MSLREDADRPSSGLETGIETRIEAGDEARAERTAPAATAASLPTPVPVEAPPARKRSMRRLVLLGLLTAALGGGAYQGWQWWTVGRFFVSTDDAYVQADISVLAAKIPGYLQSVPVVNGLAVRKGDVIAKLDDGDYRLALQAAQDKLATQESTIARIGRQAEAAQAQVAQAAAQLDATRADAVRAQADFARSTQMQADYVAKSRIDQTRADRDRTEASVKAMEAGLLAARANVDVLQAQKREAESLAAELRTAVDRARRDLDFTVIRAPFDGVVGNKAVEAGAYVGPGTRVAALVPLQSVRIDANFKETQVERMRPGQPVTVTVDAYPDREIHAVVESFSPASGSVFSLLPPDNATGNFTKIVQRVPVKIVLDDHSLTGLLRPGSGSIRVEGNDIAARSASARLDFGVTLVPEGRRVFAPMTVRENLEMGAFRRLWPRRDRKVEADMDEVFDMFPRLRERQSQPAGLLSGGEQQMLAIGRALMSRPRLLLLDEPSMGLAPRVVQDIFAIIRRLNQQGISILLAEQNANMALQTAAWGYVIAEGEIVREAESAALTRDPIVRTAYLGL